MHAFIAERTGMALSPAQARRLDERLAVLQGHALAPQYVLHLNSAAGAADLEQLVRAVVVHKTDLFRDEVQLAAFRSRVLAPRVASARGPLRVWSAGCATGEEVATLLALLEEAGADPASTVLGTDISESVLAQARTLSFPAEALRRVPPGLRERCFVWDGRRVALAPALRARASFRLHNLMDTPYPRPEGGGFDVIFCRNVLIYFTAEAFQRTVVELAGRLAPGGTLVLSSAEPLLQVPPPLKLLRAEQAFFYVRADASGAALPIAAPRMETLRTPVPQVRRDTEPVGGQGARRESGKFATVPSTPAPPGGVHPEAARLFARVLEGSTSDAAPLSSDEEARRAVESNGAREAARFVADSDVGPRATPPSAEVALRRCLELAPDLAAARYLLGLLLEQGGRPDEAVGEYRRALGAVDTGRAVSVPFLLNPARLRVACAHAIERLESASARR
ncbi:CheR family methyltransferase [Citreicoccus inhibens]|uniref:CheR family methyltransferase n=1 Tax=Citreicoccus inhibens TaxID=2849499 RepID=UPI002E29E258|nr:CheR family methyltransferase [Citreicoccus inhibens]